MRYLISRYKLFFIVLIFWFLLAQNFRIETIIAGIFICLAVTIATYNVLYDEEGYLYGGIKVRRLVIYIGFLFKEIYKASFYYVYNLLRHHYEPVIFDMELDVDDPVLVGIISNSITLTPGTITIDTDTKNHVITVMTLAKPDTPAEELERPIRESFERLLKQKKEDKL
ncbi:MAG: Na+/H+ antiporter subunit E [Candidatus Izemoplasmataceae bacterium]